MAYRELELTLLSARDLKNVNMFTRMDVYAVASISGDPMTRQCTPTDTSGGRNPSWNATFRFAIPPDAAAAGGSWLHVLLRSQRALGDRDIGEVVVPFAELLPGADAPGPQPPRLASHQVHTVLRGEPRGVLNVSYRLGPVVAPVERADDKPTVLAYPAPQQPYQYHHPHDAYAPPQQTYHPPQDAYAPQPQPYHHPHDAYAPPPQPYHPPQDVYAPQPQPYHHPHDAYVPPPRHEEALLPANGKSNGHGPTQVYMGPHTQIIFGGSPTPTPRSNTIPSKTDGPRPNPSYTPTQPNTGPGKTDQSWPKASPKMPDQSWPKASPKMPDQSWPKASPKMPDQSWPKASPKMPDQSWPKAQHDETKLGELARSQSKIGLGKTTNPSARPQALKEEDNTKASSFSSTSRKINGTQVGEYASIQSKIQADSTRPKETYANNRSNSTPGKADHQSGHKAVMQHERVPSLPTAAAR